MGSGGGQRGDQKARARPKEEVASYTAACTGPYLQTCMGAPPIIRSEKKRKKSNVIYPTVIIDDISVKLPECVSIFLLSEFCIIGRAYVLLLIITLMPVN